MSLEIEDLKISIKEKDGLIIMLMDQLKKQNSYVESSQWIGDPSSNKADQNPLQKYDNSKKQQ